MTMFMPNFLPLAFIIPEISVFKQTENQKKNAGKIRIGKAKRKISF